MDETTDRLVWVDVETTGLDPTTDRILELGVIITDGSLEPIAGMHAMFNVGLPMRMTETVWKMHTANGLLDELKTRAEQWPLRVASKSDVPHFGVLRGSFITAGLIDTLYTDAYLGFIELIKTYDAVGAPLAGSSVSFDRGMLKAAGFTVALDLLHYRNFDVSVFREAIRRWRPDVELPPKSDRHRVFDDLAVSIETARLARKLLLPDPTRVWQNLTGWSTNEINVWIETNAPLEFMEEQLYEISTDPNEMVSEWHLSDSVRELHEFMGWSSSDYGHWFATSEPPPFLQPEPEVEPITDPHTAPLDVDLPDGDDIPF